MERDENEAQDVLRNEARINQMEIEIDDFAVGLLAFTSRWRRIYGSSRRRSKSTATWNGWATWR